MGTDVREFSEELENMFKNQLPEYRRLEHEEVCENCVGEPPEFQGPADIGFEMETYTPAAQELLKTKREGLNITRELSAHVIETVSDPYSSFSTLYRQGIESTQQLAEKAGKLGSYILLAGTVPHSKTRETPLSPHKRYQHTREWFEPGGLNIRIPDARGEMSTMEGFFSKSIMAYQFNFKPEKGKQVIPAYNAAWMTAPYCIAPFLNSPFIDGTLTGIKGARLFSIQGLRGERADQCNWGSVLSSVKDYYDLLLDKFGDEVIYPVDPLNSPFKGKTARPLCDFIGIWPGVRIKNKLVKDGGVIYWVEDRYKDEGPTVLDDTAYTAFKIGLMSGFTDGFQHNPRNITPRQVRINYESVLKDGINAPVYTPEGRMTVREYINEYGLELARNGLEELKGLDNYQPFLKLVEKRADSGVTVAEWEINRFLKHTGISSPEKSLKLDPKEYRKGLFKVSRDLMKLSYSGQTIGGWG